MSSFCEGVSLSGSAIYGFEVPTNGLMLWLDASDSNTLYDSVSGGSLVTTNGASVKRWEDKSGNGYHATEATSFPSLSTNAKNSKNAIDFSSSNFLSSSPTSTALTSQTVFLVFRFNTNTNYGRLFSQARLSFLPDYQGFIPIVRSATNDAIIGYNNGGILGSNSIVQNNWYIVQSKHTGTSLSMTANAVTASTVNNLNVTIDRFRLSAAINSNDSTDGSAFGNSLFAEVLVYSRAVDATDSTDITNYLNAKWAVF